MRSSFLSSPLHSLVPPLSSHRTHANPTSPPSPVFNLSIPKAVKGVDANLLDPVKAWPNKDAFAAESVKLAGMFKTAFARYEADCAPEVVAAGPVF